MITCDSIRCIFTHTSFSSTYTSLTVWHGNDIEKSLPWLTYCVLPHTLNYTMRLIMQSAYMKAVSQRPGKWEFWIGMWLEFPERCWMHVRSDILQTDVSVSTLWAWIHSHIQRSVILLHCCLQPLPFSAWEQSATPWDESYLSQHIHCFPSWAIAIQNMEHINQQPSLSVFQTKANGEAGFCRDLNSHRVASLWFISELSLSSRCESANCILLSAM